MTYCKPFKRGASWRSQNYGANPNNGTNGPAGHSGHDEACDTGTPVHAAGDGVIEYAGTFDDTYADNLLWLIDFGGNVLVLNCGDSEPTFIYAHLSKFRVKAGNQVRKGQVIAESGNSGTRTTGPHCHVEAIPPGYVLNSPSLGRVNPDIYLTEWPDDIAGLAAMGGTITPLSEEDDLAYSEDDLTRIVKNAVNDYAMNVRNFPDGRNLMDQLIQMRTEIGLAADAAKSVPGQVLYENRVDGRNLFDWFKQLRAEISGIKPGATVDIPALATALSQQLAAADVKALATQLQITVKETPNG